jgi:hypothetical protein
LTEDIDLRSNLKRMQKRRKPRIKRTDEFSSWIVILALEGHFRRTHYKDLFWLLCSGIKSWINWSACIFKISNLFRLHYVYKEVGKNSRVPRWNRTYLHREQVLNCCATTFLGKSMQYIFRFYDDIFLHVICIYFSSTGMR